MVKAAKIYHDLKDAVVLVNITGQNYSYLTSQTDTSTGTITLQSSVDTDQTGFLIEENYIVTPFSNLGNVTNLTPAPSNNQTYTFASATTYTEGTGQAAPAQINNTFNFYNIKVRVTNVNGSHCNVAYTARVVGFDAARNIAVLRIEDLDVANRGLTPLTCEHPHLSWGKSQDLCYGSELFALTASRERTLVVQEGDVVNPLYVDALNYPQIEQVLIGEIEDFDAQLGTVVVNEHGKVVAIRIDNYLYWITANQANGIFDPNTIFVTQHQAQYIVDAIIAGIHGPLGCHLTQVNLFGYGPITIFIQPILGFSYKIAFDGNSIETVDTTSDEFIASPITIPANTNLCSFVFCDTNYCLGIAKKHVHPIQLTYKAVIGDVALLNGVTITDGTPAPFQLVATFQAPTTFLGQKALFDFNSNYHNYV